MKKQDASYEDLKNASTEQWKTWIRESLTRPAEEWVRDEDGDAPSAIAIPTRILVGRSGSFKAGDRALAQMKRSGEVVEYGWRSSGKARWALASELAIEASFRDEDKAAAEARRVAKRDAQLRELLNGDADSVLDAMRAAFEAGRRAENRYLD